MKKLIVLFAGLFMMTIAVQNVNAQSEATGSAGAAANIMKIIKITKQLDLHFGDIVPSTDAGSVRVTPAGVRDNAVNVTLFDQFTTHSAAQFKVEGDVNAAYSIDLPDDDEIELIFAGGVNMTLTNFDHNATGTLAGGEEIFEVGATLQVGANQAPGLYVGVFDVIVAYE